MHDTLALAPHQAVRPGTTVRLAEVSRRHYKPDDPAKHYRDLDQRKRFRWELEQMSKANPHLIGDIGLTRRQVEAEIAKSFWQE